MFLDIGCTIDFSVQMIILTRDLIVFKICNKPGFKKEALNATGSDGIFKYLRAICRFNDSHLGMEGGPFSNMTGKWALF